MLRPPSPSPRRPSIRPACIPLIAVLLLGGTASAETYDLPALLKLARQHNPGVAASQQATRAIDARLSEARRMWMPSGQFITMLAPVPEVRCALPPGVSTPAGVDPQTFREENCAGTTRREAANLNFAGIFARAQLTLVQPIYTFGKIESGIDAAEAGIAASRGQTDALRGKLEFNVKRAYYGLKLMRAIRETLDEGLGYVTDAPERRSRNPRRGPGLRDRRSGAHSKVARRG